MDKKVLLSIGILTVLIVAGAAGYFLWSPAPQCPVSCDDGNSCTIESCSEATNFQCKTEAVPNCCGNKSCGTGEAYDTCAIDCPTCDDNNKCTKDSFDYNKQECKNLPILDTACCGNTVCEVGENYQTCARDCISCDDDNKCTKDSYDYNKQTCLNKIITPCCGNKICDQGAEAFSSCSADCPNCDDGSKLTKDGFNYKTQKCENIVTHYLIDDFESGTRNWSFYTSMGQPTESAYTLIREGANTVLRGVGHNFADLAGEGWNDYGLKFKFKLVKGSFHINFRHNFFTPVERSARYMLNLGRDQNGGRFSVQKGLNENTGQGEYINIKDGRAAIDTGWHTLEIRVYKDIINVYFDGGIVLKYKDPNPILSGKVSFETLDNPDSGIVTEVLFDDVEIKVVGQKDIIYP